MARMKGPGRRVRIKSLDNCLCLVVESKKTVGLLLAREKMEIEEVYGYD